jgi:3-dehydroquinate synthase
VKQKTVTKIDSLAYPVYIGAEPWHEIKAVVQPFLTSGGVYILTDHHTQKYCLPVLTGIIPELARQDVFSVSRGEPSKDVFNLERIWRWLMEKGAVKDSLLINLGGGVVSDLGGFAAATYKRGIRYINVPTSLIGQADAAVGGKAGINISGVKNQAGLFYDPMAVFINPSFLTTLADAHLKSGFAEIIKCAALSGNGFWEKVKYVRDLREDHLFDLIFETVNFKCDIVAADPFDQSLRKMLNFGHTVGHALESFHNLSGQPGMLHGEAVAAGMICEAYLSSKITGLPERGLEEISNIITALFELKPLENCFLDEYFKIMQYDKKKTINGIGFSLLESLGRPVMERSVDQENLKKSFDYLNHVIQK